MNAYIRMMCGHVDGPGQSPVDDSETLVDRCLEGLDPERHPPALFVLWMTPAFEDRYRLGIEAVLGRLAERGFASVPLIGSSVAACLFDGQVYERGALLVCLA